MRAGDAVQKCVQNQRHDMLHRFSARCVALKDARRRTTRTIRPGLCNNVQRLEEVRQVAVPDGRQATTVFGLVHQTDRQADRQTGVRYELLIEMS